MTLTGKESEFRSNIKVCKKATEDKIDRRERKRERERGERKIERNMPVNCHEVNHANEWSWYGRTE